MAPQAPWTIDIYETDAGEKLVWSFIGSLQDRNKKEAVALVKLLEERGNELRRPQSGSLGEGLFELRGKEVRMQLRERMRPRMVGKDRKKQPSKR